MRKTSSNVQTNEFFITNFVLEYDNVYKFNFRFHIWNLRKVKKNIS